MIAGIGSTKPDIQPGVTIVIGPGTDVIAGRGKSSPPEVSTATSISSGRSRSSTR